MPSSRVSKMISKNALNLKSDKKIFVIGFNKCGTRSFTELFERSGIGCVHWDDNLLADYILKDIKESGTINLEKYYPESNAFTDIIYVNKSCSDGNILIVEIFEIIDDIIRSYPDAYYIVNTRNVEDWLISRSKHQRGDFASIYKQFLFKKYNIEYTDYMLTEYWRYIWYEYHYRLLQKFRNCNSIKYLFYDIEKSSITDLVKFLEPDYLVKGQAFPAKGKTTYDNNYLRIIIFKSLKRLISFLQGRA